MQMKTSTRKVTVCAVLSALTASFIYIASISITGQLGFVAVASLFGIAAVVEYNISGGVLVYVCSSLLSLLIVSDKNIVFLYILFFGYYPILKLLAERVKSKVIQWAIKLLVMNIALAVIIFAFYITLFNMSYVMNSYILLFALVNIVFVIFDIGVTRVIGYYITEILPRIRKK
jgi:hypothetical protein